MKPAERLLAELVAIRKSRGYSLSDVACRIQITPAAICLFERSHRYRRNPNLSTLVRYAAAVGAEIHATPTATADNGQGTWPGATVLEAWR
jgi:transcriptional regulator with XRE-family HTH domain